MNQRFCSICKILSLFSAGTESRTYCFYHMQLFFYYSQPGKKDIILLFWPMTTIPPLNYLLHFPSCFQSFNRKGILFYNHFALSMTEVNHESTAAPWGHKSWIIPYFRSKSFLPGCQHIWYFAGSKHRIGTQKSGGKRKSRASCEWGTNALSSGVEENG